jgi:hypothetical protein
VIICLRLVEGADGVFVEVQPGQVPASTWSAGIKYDLVATGDVEWSDDTPAEVYVPSTRLAEWRMEHSSDR